MDARDVLSEGFVNCKALTARYLAGFDDTNHTRQAPGLPNHAAWNLGHMALTMHRVAEKLDTRPLPQTEFIIGDLTRPPVDPLAPRGDAERFHTETIGFGSQPTDDRARYPGMARCVSIFDGACDRLAAAVRGATDTQLLQPVKWGAGEIPMHQLLTRMLFHNGDHVGQIADLRRALGFRSIFA